MVISSRVIIELDKAKTDLILAIEATELEIYESSQRVFKRVYPDIRKALDTTPRPSVHPFKWSNNPAANNRARRWWFKAIADGRVNTDGRRYIRSGRLGKQFSFDLIQDEKELTSIFRILGRQRDEKGRFQYRWVVGTFDKNKGTNWQIPGHRKTGWYLVQNIKDEWFDKITELIKKDVDNIKVTRRNR